MKIEPGKFYRTRGGRKARVYAVDGWMPHSVHGAIFEGGSWYITNWLRDGNTNDSFESSSDLISEWRKEPIEIEAWAVVTSSGCETGLYHRKAGAESRASIDPTWSVVRLSGTLTPEHSHSAENPDPQPGD